MTLLPSPPELLLLIIVGYLASIHKQLRKLNGEKDAPVATWKLALGVAVLLAALVGLNLAGIVK